MDELLKDLASRMLESRMRQHQQFLCSAHYQELMRRWNEKPWYRRAYIVAMNRLRDWRVRLGELIAGREFDDYY